MKIHIFDFDGTLVKTPVKNGENIRKYEKLTGLPWEVSKSQSVELTKKHKKFVPIRRGWWGRPETLEPPLVPDPAPKEFRNQSVFEDWNKSKQDDDSITIMMTGRHQGLRNHVLRICSDLDFLKVDVSKNSQPRNYNGQTYENVDPFVQCYFLGQDGPMTHENKPHETLPWKLWVIKQYIDLHQASGVDTVEMWDDRESHVKEFEACDKIWGPKFVVHLVT